MKIRIAFGVSSLLVASSFVTIVSAQTLQEAIQRTINENPEIQSEKSERLAVEHEISQAKAGYFPKVDLNAGIGWEQSTNPTTRSRGDGTVSYGREEASIQLRQMIFDGFATSSEVKRHEARTNARAFSVFGKSEIIALNAVESYINVLRRKELLGLAKENLSIHQRTNDQIKLRSERGLGKRADYYQSSGRLSLAEKNALSEIGNLQDAETAFLKVVGTLPMNLNRVENIDRVLPESLEESIEQAITNHPILKSANADIDSAFAQHETAKSPHMPRLDVEAGASHNVDIDGIKGKNEDAYAMLRLRYNLFNGGKDVARRKETRELINQAKEIRDQTYRQVVESMRLSWVARKTLQAQMEFFKAHKLSSIKSNAAYQKQFNIGQRTLLDVLDSANEMFLAKSAFTNAKFDDLHAQYRILASKGALNEHLGVSLPKETLVLGRK